MKPKYRNYLLALVSALPLAATASAATLTYDADTGSPGVQDGVGSGWNTTNVNFWDGFQNVTWANTNADEAVFGFGSGQGGTVAVGTVTTNRITFNPPGEGNFALAGGTITLDGTSPTIEVNDDSAIGSVLAGSAGLAKAGSGTLVLTGANTYSGGTTVNGGVLQLGNATSNGTFGSGSYSLAAGTTLYLNYATATPSSNLGWTYQVSGTGTLELNSAQSLNGSAKWGPDNSTAVPFSSSFTGTLQVDKGRFDSSAAGLGGVTKIAIKTGGQLMAWAGGTYTPALEIAGTGYGESGQSGAIRSTGTTTFSGNVTLTDNAQIMVNSGATLTLTGSITGLYVCEFYPSSTSGVINVTPAAAVQNSYAGTKVNASGTSSNSVVAGNQYAFGTGGLEVVQGILKLNGFNFSFASLSGTGGRVGNYSATTASTLTVGTGNTSTSYGGVILNGGTAVLNMVKTGTGSLTLTGNSTYTGTTSVNGGALLLNATSGLTTTTAISVASGATFGGKGTGGATAAAAGSTIQGGFNNAGNLALSSLTFGGSSVLNLSPLAGTTASLAITGALSTSGTQTVNIVNSSPLPAGSYRLVSYGSITGSGSGAFALGTTPPSTGFRSRTYSLDTTPTTYLGLTVASDTAVWSGGADGNWDAVTLGNWKQLSDGAPTQYYPSDTVQFGDADGVRAVVLGTVDVSPASVAFTNGAGFDYTLSGVKAITGAAPLTKSGAGTVTITNTNSYTGGTTISGGTLQLGDGTTNGVITGAITDNANLAFANGSAQTFSGVVSGTGTVSKSGSGVLTLSGTNTYTGATNINGGVLAGSNFKANGTTCNLGNGTVVNLNGGTLRYTGGQYGGDGTSAKFNRTINVGAAGGTFDTSATGPFWYDGTFTGSGTLNIICSAGTSRNWLITSNSPDFSGNVVIGTGTAGSGFAQPRSNAAYPLGTGTITINTGGVLSCDNGTTSPTGIANNMVLNGGLLGTQIPNVTYSGNVTASTGTTSTVGNYTSGNPGDVTLSGSLLGDGTISSVSFDVANRSVRLAGNNSGFAGTWRSTSGKTYFNTAASGSAAAKWVGNGAPLVGNIAGGGTVSLGELSGTSGTIRNDVTGTTFVVSVGALGTNSTFGGGITDKSGDSTSKTGLTKIGPGTLTLTGTTTAYTYTGPTTVNAGALEVPPNTAGTTDVTVGDGAALVIGGAPGSTYNVASLTLGSLTGSTLGIRNFGSLAATAPVSAVNALTANGSVTVNVDGVFETGVFPLIQYPIGGGIGGGGFSSFVLGSIPRGISASLVNNPTESSIDLSITGVNDLVWKGNDGSDWEVGGTAKPWLLGAVAETFQNADRVRFDDTAVGSTTITLDTVATPGSVTFSNSAKDYTITGAGAIAGSIGVGIAGEGKVTLATLNTYTGATTVGADATLVLGDGTFDGHIAGPLVNNGEAVFNVVQGDTYAGAISGSGTFIAKRGDGTQIWTGGTNTFSGAVKVEGGTLQIGNGTTNANFGSSSYEVASGAKLFLNYATADVSGPGLWSTRITGAGTLELKSAQGGNGTANWGSSPSAGPSFAAGFTGTLQIDNGRYESVPTGMGGITKLVIKDTAQFLAWNGTYPQEAIIAGQNGWGETGYLGALRLAAGSTATWSGSVTLVADSGIMSQADAHFTIEGPITGNYQCEFRTGSPTGANGFLHVAPAAPVQNSYGSTKISGAGVGGAIIAGNQYAFSTGPLLMAANGVLELNGFSFTFANLSGTGGTIGNYGTDPSALTVGSDGSSTSCAAVLADGGTGTLELVKTGAGTLTLTGTNTYTGGTTISAGTLQVNSAASLPGSVANNATLAFGNTAAMTFAGSISGTGSLAKSGAGNLTLTGSNSYTGNTSVNAGTLTLSSATLADTSTVTLGSGTVLVLNTAAADTVAALVINGTPVPNGTYGASHPTYGAYFAGSTGTLVVGGGYDSWAQQITNAADRDRTDDPDGDGFSNLQEFLFGTSPVAGNAALTTTERSGGNLIIRWKQLTSGSTYRLLESATLGNPWTLSGATVTNDGAQTGDYQPKKAEVPVGTGKNFFRVEGVEN